MQVVILCGGQGTRLAEETEIRPKPMIEIGDRPILWHIMKTYSHFGFHDFILCLGYKGDVIRDHFLNYYARNSDVRVRLGEGKIDHLAVLHDERQWTVVLAETGTDTPTGGRVKRAARYIEGPRFLCTYGDGLADVDIRALVTFHERSTRLATVTAIRPVTRFGELRVDGDRVTEFREKEPLREGWINGGFFVFERGVLDLLTDQSTLGGGSARDETNDVLESLATQGQLAAYRHDGYWRAMDTLREKRDLEREWRTGSPPWKVW
jgi:glucose-1-phosphate cytidylyltransferase